jgi:hypothetical protein
MNLKGLGNIPAGLRRGLIVGVSVLFFAGLFYLLYLPKIREIRKITAQIDSVEKHIEEAERIERSFRPPSAEEEKKWKQAESELYLLIPPEKHIQDLIYKLAELAKRCNIRDISFKSEKEVITRPVEGRKAVSPVIPTQIVDVFGKDVRCFFIRLSFHSEYKDLARFLEETQRIDRLVEIERLVIKRNFPLISVEMVVKAYYRQRSEV